MNDLSRVWLLPHDIIKPLLPGKPYICIYKWTTSLMVAVMGCRIGVKPLPDLMMTIFKKTRRKHYYSLIWIILRTFTFNRGVWKCSMQNGSHSDQVTMGSANQWLPGVWFLHGGVMACWRHDMECFTLFALRPGACICVSEVSSYWFRYWFGPCSASNLYLHQCCCQLDACSPIN